MAIVSRNYNLIRDFHAQVSLTATVGSVEKGTIKEYPNVTAHIYFRRPADIRILASWPVGTLFDMVSDGTNFKLSIPHYSRFLVGRNETTQRSAKNFENVRPQDFLEALLVAPFPDARRVAINNFTDEEDQVYNLSEFEDDGSGGPLIRRTIQFSRVDLGVTRQQIFDDDGNILSDARYSGWKYFDLAPFPTHIDIKRPQDEYGVVIDVIKMDINKTIANDRFVVPQPPGYTLQVIGEPPAPVAPGATPPARRRGRAQ